MTPRSASQIRHVPAATGVAEMATIATAADSKKVRRHFQHELPPFCLSRYSPIGVPVDGNRVIPAGEQVLLRQYLLRCISFSSG